MSELEKLNINLGRLRQLLDLEEMDPDPARTDFYTHTDRLQEITDLIETGVLDVLDGALLELKEESERAKVKSIAAALAGEVACLLHAAGKRDKVSLLFSRARSVDPMGPKSTLFNEIERDYTVMVRLNRAEWLLARNRRVECEHIAKDLMTLRAFPETAKWAKIFLDAPKPIKTAPSLYTVNGIGTSLWGKRDKRPDSTYIATRCFVFFFIPIFAIDAYRVRHNGGNLYSFFNKVPLSAFARWWRRLLVSAVLAAAVSSIAKGFLNTPERRLSRDLQAARAAESAARDEAGTQRALDLYNQIVVEYAFMQNATLEAADAVLRIEIARIPKPLRLSDVPKAQSVFQQYQGFSDAQKAGTANKMATQLALWATSLKDKNADAVIREKIALLDNALSISNASNREEARRQKSAAVLQWGKMLEVSRPMDAVHRYLSIPNDPQAVRAAAAVLEKLKDTIGIWTDLQTEGSTFATAVQSLGLKDLDAQAAALKEKTAEEIAWASSSERTALLQSEDEKPLIAALAKSPRDQVIAESLAGLKRGRGQSAEAIKILESARGDTGVFSRWAELDYIDCLIDLERFEEAGERLEQILACRLSDYRDVAKKYVEAAEEMQSRLATDANAGLLQKDIQEKLDKAPQSDQQAIFSAWLNEKMAGDANLTALRDAYLAMWDVVPVALKLGSVSLQRARRASGDRKTELLRAAEEAFLSVSADATGDPAYHIGLGQVYYRLGKAEQGEAEIQQVLKQNNPTLSLSAANVYRELGLHEKAVHTAESLYNSAPSPVKEDAAVLRSLLSPELEEQETWLKRADAKSSHVTASLLQIEGEQLFNKGEIKRAEDTFKEAERIFTKSGATDDSALNNAALVARRRYEISGDVAHIERAAALLEKVARHLQGNSLVLSNLAQTLKFRAELKILGKWMKIDALKLTADETAALIAYMQEGPNREELLQQIRAGKDMARSLALVKQAEVLSPKMAPLYRTESDIASAFEDEKALSDIIIRINAQNGIDTGGGESERADWIAGKNDTRIKDRTMIALLRLEKDLEQIRKGGHAPTLAAALFKVAWAHLYLTYLDTPLPHLDAAERTFAEAAKTWPPIGAEYGMAVVLFSKAILGAMPKSPTLSTLWNKERRSLSEFSIVTKALNADESGTAPALMSQPEMKLLIAMLEADQERPDTLSLVAARIAKTPALKTAASTVRKRETTRLSAEIDSLLNPESEDIRILRTVLETP